jgi:hypothetical protein
MRDLLPFLPVEVEMERRRGVPYLTSLTFLCEAPSFPDPFSLGVLSLGGEILYSGIPSFDPHFAPLFEEIVRWKPVYIPFDAQRAVDFLVFLLARLGFFALPDRCPCCGSTLFSGRSAGWGCSSCYPMEGEGTSLSLWVQVGVLKVPWEVFLQEVSRVFREEFRRESKTVPYLLSLNHFSMVQR